MKASLIWAYTQINLGDDLFIKILTERYPNQSFSILGTKSKMLPFKGIKNLKVIKTELGRFDSLLKKIGLNIGLYDRKINKLAQQHDLTINIGGSIFIESPEWKKNLEIYSRVIHNSKRFVILGSNFGPFVSDSYYQQYLETFKDASDICFRETISYDLFKEIPTVRKAPDIVFNLNIDRVEDYTETDYVLVSVMNLAVKKSLKQYKDIYEENIVSLCQDFIGKGQKVKLMSFCKSEGDEVAIERIMEKISSPLLTSYYYKGDMDGALSVIKSSKSVIATRFHSMILAFVFNKPVYPIIYSDKTLNVLNDVDFTGNYSHVGEPIDLKVLNEQLNFEERNHITLESQNQFAYLDTILGDN